MDFAKYLIMSNRAGRYIACDCHAHLVSKASSVISAKSPSPAFKWSDISPRPNVKLHIVKTTITILQAIYIVFTCGSLYTIYIDYYMWEFLV